MYGLPPLLFIFCRTPFKAVRVGGGGSLLFITAVPITKLFAWGEGDSGGHVLWDSGGRVIRGTTRRDVCTHGLG
jgi:hypothetical protein